MSGKGTVLVTGGSGYIGGWCIVGLLNQGYTVRTTIRSLAREAEVRAWLSKHADTTALTFHAADLMNDAGWDEAAAGCDYMLHVASPLGIAEPKDPNELIVPAREGARRAITAAIKAGIKRVVQTSSVAAATAYAKGDSLTDEAIWTDLTRPGVSAYNQSKTIAEKTAWDLIKASDGKTTLATVNPALVLGPVMGKDFSDSLQVLERLLTGRVPGIPRLGFSIVDVRDVADLHIRAMTDPAAAGERFIAATSWAWMSDLADILRANLPAAAAAKVPTRKMPDIVMRLVGLMDRDLASAGDRLGKKADYTSAKAQKLLGWAPRPVKDTVMETANSLIAEGVA